MQQALHAFVNQIIDYAGMFPPAKLSFEDAFTEYSKYCDVKSGLHNILLSRAIFPISALPSLETAILNSNPEPLPSSGKGIAILFKKPQKLEEVVTFFDHDLNAIHAFNQHMKTAHKKSYIDCLEVFLPETVDALKAEELIMHMLSTIDSKNLKIADLCIEAAIPKFKGFLSATLKKIAMQGKFKTRLVAKMRTGGLTPEEIPAIETVAVALMSFCENHIPFKATAGLHHPTRHLAKNPPCKMHGFFNVFLGAMLAGDSPSVLNELLAIEAQPGTKPSRFSASDEHIVFGSQAIAKQKIVELRSNFALSFGSCSILEPAEDLSVF